MSLAESVIEFRVHFQTRRHGRKLAVVGLLGYGAYLAGNVVRNR